MNDQSCCRWQAEDTPETPFVPLQNVFLHVTKQCNLSCQYCYFSARHAMQGELRTDEFVPLWRALAVLCPKKVVFTGGEPLLRSDLFDLLRGLRLADRERSIISCLNTNGHLVTAEFAKSLVGLVDEVRVSLDAFEARNDALRGDGNFAAALGALERYHAAGFEPKVLITATRLTLPDLEELICFLIQRGFVYLNVNPFRAVGRGSSRFDLAVAKSEVDEIVRRAWMRARPNRPMPQVGSEGATQCHCGVGRFLNILPNGDVYPCHVLTQPRFRCGNVREESLLEICRRSRLLGRLSRLDFGEMARTDDRLAPLTVRGGCLGESYSQYPEVPVWSKL